MRSTHVSPRAARTAVALIAASVTVAGCGGSSSSKPSNLPLSISEQGKTAKFTIPASARGGLTRVALTNSGQAPHAAQLILVTGGHTPAEAVKQVAGNSNKTPNWLRAEGGVGTTLGGQTRTATVNLPKGNYVIVDTASLRSGAPPAFGQTKLSKGKTGTVPKYVAHITGLQTGKDKYAWQITGLKAGTNPLDLVSKGKGAIHAAVAIKVKGNPSLATIKKALQSNSGPPPSFVAPSPPADTAALDGGKSVATSLTLTAGQYVVFCPLTDRDGGKPHFLQGMLKKVTVG